MKKFLKRILLDNISVLKFGVGCVRHSLCEKNFRHDENERVLNFYNGNNYGLVSVDQRHYFFVLKISNVIPFSAILILSYRQAV